MRLSLRQEKSIKDVRVTDETVQQFIQYFGLEDLDQYSLEILKSTVNSLSQFANKMLQDVSKMVDTNPDIDTELGAEIMTLNSLPNNEEDEFIGQHFVEHFAGSEFLNDRSIKIFQLASNYLLNKGIAVLNTTYTIVNANTSSTTWNDFATAYADLFNSKGWTGIDTSINTLGNLFTIYDATGNGIDRYIALWQAKEKKKSPPDDTAEKLQTAVDEQNDHLTAIKDLVMEILCHKSVMGREAMMSSVCSAQKEEDQEEEQIPKVPSQKVINRPVISNKIISQYYLGNRD